MISPIAFDKEKVFHVYERDVLDSYLDEPKVWYIVDDKEPKKVEAKTILVCSPRKNHYRNFDKYIGTTIRYMPVWSAEEIETSKEPSQQKLLNEAITKSSNSKIFNFVGEIDSDDDLHRLIHIHTNIPNEENEECIKTFYIDKIIKFASDYVARQVMDKLESKYKQDLKNFVATSDSINECSTLRGFMFEEIAHRIFTKGRDI
ncbi:3012_t:CDS:2 [Diversispora eburnea]|uniref:3012_t:CDS:1 n=1 Tax=Diversispora eburnea TaxID=1213867 RepID=A0A9N9FBU9_9GLOM|nr:3012_t:CDS:2 [Diversispora eburnea]